MKYKINGKEYESKKFDFEALVKLEECGVTMQDFKKVTKPLTLITGLVAWIADLSKEEAIQEINEHIQNGGNISDCAKILESIKESDFFQKAMKDND